MSAPTQERREAPHSDDAEVSVIAAMMLEESAIVAVGELLDETMFYREKHRRLFKAIKVLFAQGTPPDPVSLAAQLESTGDLAGAGGREYLGELLYAIPTAANVTYHAGIVRDRALRRRVIDLARAAEFEAREVTTPIDVVTDALAKGLVPIATGKRQNGFEDVKYLVWPYIEHLERLGQPEYRAGVLTGYPEFDEKLFGGFQKGDFIILCGVPNSGKTAVLLNWLVNAAADAGVHGALVSAEMTRDGVIGRMVANLASVSGTKLRSGKLTVDENRAVVHAVSELGKLPLALDDTPMPDLEDVVAKIRLRKAKDPELRLVGVDFIQLVQARAERGELGEAVLRRICYTLKALALELDLSLIATCQPNDKQIEDREEKRPTLRDLQGSAGMRQAADLVILLYRPGQYNTAGPNVDVELNVAKARDIPAFRQMLGWDGTHQRVTSRGREIVERNRRELREHGKQGEL